MALPLYPRGKCPCYPLDRLFGGPQMKYINDNCFICYVQHYINFKFHSKYIGLNTGMVLFSM
jgi:uncharacterized protein (DUF1919 family)